MTATPVSTSPVEPGNTTSEYQLTGIGAAVVGVAEASLGVADAFGAHLSSSQVVSVQGFVVALVTLIGTYSISRGIRKKGQ